MIPLRYEGPAPEWSYECNLEELDESNFIEDQIKTILAFYDLPHAYHQFFYCYGSELDLVDPGLRSTFEEMLKLRAIELRDKQHKTIQAIFDSIIKNQSDPFLIMEMFTSKSYNALKNDFNTIEKKFSDEAILLGSHINKKYGLAQPIPVKKLEKMEDLRRELERRQHGTGTTEIINGPINMPVAEFRKLIQVVIQCAIAKGKSPDAVTEEEALQFDEERREKLFQELTQGSIPKKKSKNTKPSKPVNTPKQKPIDVLICEKLHSVCPFELHARVLRWQTPYLKEARQFRDRNPNGYLAEIYKDKDDQELAKIRICHNLMGTEMVFGLGEHDVYTFKTNKGYAVLAELHFGKEVKLGLITFGINEKTIFHRYFREIGEFKDLKTVLENEEVYDIIFESLKKPLEQTSSKNKNNTKREYQFSVSQDRSITITYAKNLSVKILPVKNV